MEGMDYETQLRQLIWQSDQVMAILRTVRQCEPPDWLVGTSLPVLGTIIGAASGSQKLFVLNQK